MWAKIDLFPEKVHKTQVSLVPIVGILSFVLTVLLICFLTFLPLNQKWTLADKDAFTVEIPLLSSLEEPSTSKILVDVIDYLQKIPALESIQLVEQEELLKILRPWIGDNMPFSLPYFIDVKVKNNQSVDITRLVKELRHFAAGIQIHTYSSWEEIIQKFNLSILFGLLGLISGIGMILVLFIIILSRHIIQGYRKTIDVLRLLGVTSTTISRQLYKRNFLLSFKGAFWGSSLAFLFSLLCFFFIYRFHIVDFLQPFLILKLLMVFFGILLFVPLFNIFISNICIRKCLKELNV